MTTTQHTRTVDRQPVADPTRRAATVVGLTPPVVEILLRHRHLPPGPV